MWVTPMLALAPLGCGSSSFWEAPPQGSAPDSGRPDAGSRDGGVGTDAGTKHDGGMTADAGLPIDAGRTEVDAGPAGCTINGASYLDGDLNPLNSCEICQQATSSNSWTPLPDQSPCANAGFCADGACIDTCLIDGGVFPPGTTTDLGCGSCIPAQSRTSWTAVPDGTPCPMNPANICYQFACRTGCLISGGFYPVDRLNPQNDCQSCQPRNSSSGWTNRAVGVPCVDGGICGVTGTCLAPNFPVCTVGSVQVRNRASNPADPSLCCNAALDPSHWSPRLVLASTGAADLANDLATGDFNSDGWLDVAAINSGYPSMATVYLNQSGELTTGVDYATGREGRAIVSVDIDGDGFTDLVTEDATAATLSVLRNKGDGTFYPAVAYPSGPAGQGSLGVGDLNGDGVPDIVLGTGGLLLFIGIGDGGLLPAQTLAPSLGEGEVALADFNGDGLLDIAVADFYSTTVTVLLASGNGVFLDGVTYDKGAQNSVAWTVAAGDLNGDGIPDLAVATGLNLGDGMGALGVLLGGQGGVFGRWTLVVPPGAAGGVAVSDLDQDGTNEVLFTSSTTPSTAIYQISSGQALPLLSMDVDGGGWFDQLKVGDFNQDGAQDVAVISYPNVSLYLNGCP